VKLVLFADLAGERAALESLLQSAARLGDEVEMICLGGAASGGPDPQGTLEMMRRKRVTLVAGAADRALLKDPVGLERPEVAWLRNAAAPRRLVAGGRPMLLTPDPAAQDATYVVKPGERAEINDRAATTGRVKGSRGEAPFLVLDLATGALSARHAIWDAAAPTRHVE
jgi:hypothetical protein